MYELKALSQAFPINAIFTHLYGDSGSFQKAPEPFKNKQYLWDTI
jgi:hypothetical protein